MSECIMKHGKNSCIAGACYCALSIEGYNQLSFKQDSTQAQPPQQDADRTIIPLTQGKFALIDEEDYDALIKYKWYLSKSRKTSYAARDLNGKHLLMHRMIMGEKNNSLIDHMDGNGLNNQKTNLRYCTNSQNCMNRGKQKNNTSGYSGVMWKKRDGVYVSQITCQGEQVHIGTFKCKHEAALAYNEKAIEFHKEFACLNEIPQKELSNIITLIKKERDAKVKYIGELSTELTVEKMRTLDLQSKVDELEKENKAIVEITNNNADISIAITQENIKLTSSNKKLVDAMTSIRDNYPVTKGNMEKIHAIATNAIEGKE